MEDETLFNCVCGSRDHLFCVLSDPDYDEVYITIFLNSFRKFWARLRIGLRYIFLSSNDYVYQEVLLDYNSTLKLKDALEKHLEKWRK